MSGFNFNGSNLSDNIQTFGVRMEAAIEIYALTQAKILEGYAKANRPWKDRSHAARLQLHGSIEKQPKRVRIKLSHGVSYGIQLEYAREKKYAILEPTVRLKSPEVLSGMRSLANRLKV